MMLRQNLAISFAPRRRISAAAFAALITFGFVQSTYAQRDDYSGPPSSLRDFDLETRMFRYSMIYSDAFDGLPDQVRRRILNKMKPILASDVVGEDAEKFAHLSEDDHRNIQQILTVTKPEFAAISKGETNDNHHDSDG